MIGASVEHANVSAGELVEVVETTNKMADLSKQVEQTNKTERKSIYTLDNGERYVDFVLASQLEFAQDVTVPDDFTTNVYITDILPKGLTYVEGSSKYGGTYKENTPSAGTVTGGDNIEPESITKT